MILLLPNVYMFKENGRNARARRCVLRLTLGPVRALCTICDPPLFR